MVMEINVCVGYETKKGITYRYDKKTNLDECTPIYERFPGWRSITSKSRRVEDLPSRSREYVEYLQELLKNPVDIISVGPSAEETIVSKNLF